ncbi:uncharacterized protein LOC116068747 isoform X2 [Mastomys coucha]|uniref:uncharacterized protein LOC116068747 isoform X2 n=1 Tax=Mastomys coucha TaxID=35658 RepID=UPI0012623DCF|nr:uncharacterized protein LOC116068747 isoform X2 [Mastomys coucha]
MFSFFQTSGGSVHKKAKSGHLGHYWRRWIRPLTHVWHASHRDPKVCPQNKMEPDSLHKPPKFNYNSIEFIDQMVHYIPAAVQNHDHLSISIFFAVYQKYGSFQPDCVEDQQIKSAIFSFLSRWLQKFPEDFCEAPDMAIVRQFMDYVRLNVPSVDVDTQANELLLALEEQEAKELKLEKDYAASPEPSVPDAWRMQETLALKPASVAEPRGDQQAREDTELVEPAVLEPFVPEAGPVRFLTLNQALSTSADTQSHADMAADVAADVTADVASDVAADKAVDVAAGVSAARQVFLSAIVQVGAPDFIFPLPEVDI